MPIRSPGKIGQNSDRRKAGRDREVRGKRLYDIKKKPYKQEGSWSWYTPQVKYIVLTVQEYNKDTTDDGYTEWNGRLGRPGRPRNPEN